MKTFINRYLQLNIILKFLPFLILYICICIFLPRKELYSDEYRYLMFAHNLLNGFYSNHLPDINLWNGPGYPLFLMPFVYLKISVLGIRILNAFLLFASLIINFKTLCVYSSKKNALIFVVLMGMYFPIFEALRTIMTECISWFLVSLICFLFIKNYRSGKNSWKLIILCAFMIAFLAMTKVIFGYVILIMIILSMILSAFPKYRSCAKTSALIFFISMILCLPWLTYTYNITNKLFYWSNSGNMSLYTMSTPFKGESGDWYNLTALSQNPNHKHFIDSISKLKPLPQDEALKIAAVQNIKNYPLKYLSNIFSNVGRLFFRPNVSTTNRVVGYLPAIPNLILVLVMFMAIFISIKYYSKIPQELFFLLLFISIYLFGSLLLSTYRRMFYISIPFWFIFILYTLTLDTIFSTKIKKLLAKF